jgi:hypothetical protein
MIFMSGGALRMVKYLSTRRSNFVDSTVVGAVGRLIPASVRVGGRTLMWAVGAEGAILTP